MLAQRARTPCRAAHVLGHPSPARHSARSPPPPDFSPHGACLGACLLRVPRVRRAAAVHYIFESDARDQPRAAAGSHGAGRGHLFLRLRVPRAQPFALESTSLVDEPSAALSSTWPRSSTAGILSTGIRRRRIFSAAAQTARTPRATGGAAAATAAATRRVRLPSRRGRGLQSGGEAARGDARVASGRAGALQRATGSGPSAPGRGSERGGPAGPTRRAYRLCVAFVTLW